VADADPPNEVDNGKAPRHRLRNAPDADAFQEQPGHGHHQHGRPRAGHAEDGKPAQRRARREHDTRDLLSDRPEGLALPYDSEFSG